MYWDKHNGQYTRLVGHKLFVTPQTPPKYTYKSVIIDAHHTHSSPDLLPRAESLTQSQTTEVWTGARLSNNTCVHVCLIVCSFSDPTVLKVGGRFRKMAETHSANMLQACLGLPIHLHIRINFTLFYNVSEQYVTTFFC